MSKSSLPLSCADDLAQPRSGPNPAKGDSDYLADAQVSKAAASAPVAPEKPKTFRRPRDSMAKANAESEAQRPRQGKRPTVLLPPDLLFGPHCVDVDDSFGVPSDRLCIRSTSGPHKFMASVEEQAMYDTPKFFVRPGYELSPRGPTALCWQER
jgi:hypothetical protein